MKHLYSGFTLIVVLVMMMGLFLGPIGWYSSSSIQSEYTAFISDATKTTGVVYKKTRYTQGRTRRTYVSVRYNTNGQFNALASKVEVEPLMCTNLKMDETVNLYYKNVDGKREIVFEGAADSENLGPIWRPFFGIVLTIYSYLALLTLIISSKMKYKILANPFDKKKKS